MLKNLYWSIRGDSPFGFLGRSLKSLFWVNLYTCNVNKIEILQGTGISVSGKRILLYTNQIKNPYFTVVSGGVNFVLKKYK